MNKTAYTLRDSARIMKALCDQNRLRIMMVLRSGPMTVGEIREVIGISMSTVSRHLAILRDAGFIIDEKRGKWVRYGLRDKPPKPLDEILGAISGMIHEDRSVRHDRITAGTAAVEIEKGRSRRNPPPFSR